MHHDDEALLAAIAADDPAAFARLFDRYADLVYNVCFRRTGSWAVAEDLTSAVFLEAWRRRHSVRLHAGSLRPWLLGVSLNLVRRHWRSSGRATRAIERLRVVEAGDDHAAAVAAKVDDERRVRAVLDMLASLSDDHREVLLLWAWDGLGYEETAGVLGVRVGTVRSRLNRARAHLRSLDGTGATERALPDDVSEPRTGEREVR